MTLFTTAYFPSISYMARFLIEDAPVIEIWETYHKQTYRNRCRVMTANGMESLSVPVVKVNGNHTMTKDVAISTIEPWQHITAAAWSRPTRLRLISTIITTI